MPPRPQNQERSSICQSLLCLDLVSFPVLSQIKPQAPLLVCPSVNSFKFQPCDHTPPGTQTLTRFLSTLIPSVRTPCTTCTPIIPRPALVGIVDGRDYDGI